MLAIVFKGGMTPCDLDKGRIIFREPTRPMGGGGPRRDFRR